MSGEVIKIYPYFSDYNFLKLYCAFSVKEQDFPVIYNEEFLKQLYKFYRNPKLRNLFTGISSVKNSKNQEIGCLDLRKAFMVACTLGILAQVSDKGKLRSVVMLDKKTAKAIIKSTDKAILQSMDILFSSMKNIDEAEKIKKLKFIK